MDTTPQLSSPTTHRATTPSSTASRAGFTRRLLVVLREPFRAATWRRLAYLLLALPVGLLCVPIALVGGPAGRIQGGLARRLLGVEVERPAVRGPRTLALALVSSPLNLIAVTVACYFWLIVVINIGYPLRAGNDYADAWGGPSLAGAWAFHAVFGGLAFLLLTPWVMRGFTALQARLITGFLAADRSGRVRSTAIALGVVAVCALLSVPVIHQL